MARDEESRPTDSKAGATLLPAAETDFDRMLRARLEAGRPRVAHALGESAPVAVRPREEIHACVV